MSIIRTTPHKFATAFIASITRDWNAPSLEKYPHARDFLKSRAIVAVKSFLVALHCLIRPEGCPYEKRPEVSAFRSVARKTRVIPFSSSSSFPSFSFIASPLPDWITDRLGTRTNGGHRAAYKLLNNARGGGTQRPWKVGSARRQERFVGFASKKKKKEISPLPSCVRSKPISHGNEFLVSSIKTDSENPPRHVRTLPRRRGQEGFCE